MCAQSTQQRQSPIIIILGLTFVLAVVFVLNRRNPCRNRVTVDGMLDLYVYVSLDFTDLISRLCVLNDVFFCGVSVRRNSCFVSGGYIDHGDRAHRSRALSFVETRWRYFQYCAFRVLHDRPRPYMPINWQWKQTDALIAGDGGDEQ